MIKQHPTLPILCDSETGMFSRIGTDKWSAGSNHPTGYMTCRICGKSYRVHRLIADTFLETEEGKDEVDHIDRDRKNNCLANLRRVSHKENCRNTAAFDAVESRGWRHKNEGYQTDLYLNMKDSDAYKKKAAERARKWIAKNPEKHRTNSLNYYHRMRDAGFRQVKGPDGKRHWVKEGSLSSTVS